MKLLINAISARIGGIATYTTNLATSLNERKQPFTIYTSPGFDVDDPVGNREENRKVDVQGYSALRRLVWEQTVWRRVVRESDAEVLFSSANYAVLNPGCSQLLLLREGGLINSLYLRYVMPRQSWHHRLEARLRRFWMLYTARFADVLMVPTETMRDWVLNWAPEYREKIVVNWYGCEPSRFAATNRRGWRVDGRLRLLFVSVYYPHKDPLTLARAIRDMNMSGDDVCGRVTMEENQFLRWRAGRDEWMTLKDPELSANIEYGSIPYGELKDAYAGHDVLVFPSISETFGHSLVEAMASGIPIVAADTLSNREICGSAALYYPLFDHEALIARIRSLDADEGLRFWMAEEGMRRVEAKFRWDSHVDRLVDIFERTREAKRD